MFVKILLMENKTFLVSSLPWCCRSLFLCVIMHCSSKSKSKHTNHQHCQRLLFYPMRVLCFSVRILRVVPNAMVAPKVVSRIVGSLHRQQLLVHSSLPIVLRPSVQHIRTFAEIALVERAVQRALHLLRGERADVPQHQRCAQTAGDGSVVGLSAPNVSGDAGVEIVEAAAMSGGIGRCDVGTEKSVDTDVKDVHHDGGKRCAHGETRDKDTVLRTGLLIRRVRDGIVDGETELRRVHGEQILKCCFEVGLCNVVGSSSQDRLETIAKTDIVWLTLTTGIDVFELELPCDRTEVA